MKTKILIPLIAILTIAGCATSNPEFEDIEIITETHPRFHLINYGSYAWQGNASIVYDPNGRWEPPSYDLDEEVRFQVNTRLREMGLRESSVGPDLLVSFGIAIQTEDLPFQQDPTGEMASIEDIPQGALIISLIDPDLGYAVWAGLAVANIDVTPDADLSRRRLEYAIGILLDTLTE